MVAVRLERVSKVYGTHHAARDVDLEIGDGEFVTLLGASGSGKTTCLRMIGGFVQPTSGRVLFGGRDVTHVPPNRRDTGMVFQQYALFPHLTVAQNVAFGLKVRRLPTAEVRRRTEEALRLVRLSALGERYPSQLSGGQKQRVALARAVVINPRVLLLDEPLGALDQKLREELQGEIKRVQQTLNITAVFVTHDQGEALGLSDRVAVMHDGGIVQVDTPDALYRRPANRYVAGFIGRMNFLDVQVEATDGDFARVSLPHHPGLQLEATVGSGLRPGGNAVLAIRPEHVRLAEPGLATIPVEVADRTYSGESWLISCTTPVAGSIAIRLPGSRPIPQPSDRLHLAWHPTDALLLPA
ncbi:ABC transporter ATP-binding protein [Zavarzinia sp. CC-PAN008]|uniref:ABC transporter ATP-binding protein n=1 Tax=Zavarzinia sp. CC-PAN008 TaxID=3243332 RepID=UPI003F746688